MVFYKSCCGIISSHKACCGLVPTSLVRLAYNRKSCVQDQEFQNSFPNFQNLVRFILFCSFLGVRRDSFAKITIFVYIFLNLTVDSLVGNKTKLTTRVSWINSFQNLFGELALAGHVSQHPWPVAINFRFRPKTQRKSVILVPFFKKYFVLDITF